MTVRSLKQTGNFLRRNSGRILKRYLGNKESKTPKGRQVGDEMGRCCHHRFKTDTRNRRMKVFRNGQRQVEGHDRGGQRPISDYIALGGCGGELVCFQLWLPSNLLSHCLYLKSICFRVVMIYFFNFRLLRKFELRFSLSSLINKELICLAYLSLYRIIFCRFSLKLS